MVKQKVRPVACGLVSGVLRRVHTVGTQVPRLPFQQWFGFTFVRDPSSELKSKMRSSFVIQDSDAIVASRSESNRSQIRQDQQHPPEESGVSSSAVRERENPSHNWYTKSGKGLNLSIRASLSESWITQSSSESRKIVNHQRDSCLRVPACLSAGSSPG